MKTEAEIRKYRDALRVARKLPCGCAGTVHQATCERGGLMMEANEMLLSWILGEWSQHDHCVETIIAVTMRHQTNKGS